MLPATLNVPVSRVRVPALTCTVVPELVVEVTLLPLRVKLPPPRLKVVHVTVPFSALIVTVPLLNKRAPHEAGVPWRKPVPTNVTMPLPAFVNAPVTLIPSAHVIVEGVGFVVLMVVAPPNFGWIAVEVQAKVPPLTEPIVTEPPVKLTAPETVSVKSPTVRMPPV